MEQSLTGQVDHGERAGRSPGGAVRIVVVHRAGLTLVRTVWEAARTPGVLIGLVGTSLLAFGGTSAAFCQNPEGWPWALSAWLGSVIDLRTAWVCLFLGTTAAALGWWMLRPHPGRPDPSPGAVLTLWCLPLLLGPPVFSGDAYAYADIGWMLHQGGDTNRLGIGSMGGPYVAWVDPMHVGGDFVGYPPLSQLANLFGVEIMGLHPHWGVVGQRIVAIAGVALTVVFLPRVAAALKVSSRWASWFGLLNPLLVIHFVGGSHVDALAVGLTVAALWVATRPVPLELAGLILSPILLGLAVAVKPYCVPAIVAAVGFPIANRMTRAPWGRRVWSLSWRTIVGGLVALAMFAAFSLVTGFGFGWTRFLMSAQLSSQPQLLTFAPVLLLGDASQRLLGLLGMDGAWASPVALRVVMAAAVGGLGWLWVCRAHQPMRVAAWGSVIAVSWGQAMHPWYLVLAAILFSLIDSSERQARALVFGTLGYVHSCTYMLVSGIWIGAAIGVDAALALWMIHRTIGGNEPIFPRDSC